MTTDDRTRAIAWFEKQAKCLATPGAAKMFGLAVEALNAGRWIPVSERLPEKSCSYLVHFKSGTIKKLYFHHKVKKWISGDKYVTHWMPLPEPPRKDDEA